MFMNGAPPRRGSRIMRREPPVTSPARAALTKPRRIVYTGLGYYHPQLGWVQAAIQAAAAILPMLGGKGKQAIPTFETNLARFGQSAAYASADAGMREIIAAVQGFYFVPTSASKGTTPVPASGSSQSVWEDYLVKILQYGRGSTWTTIAENQIKAAGFDIKAVYVKLAEKAGLLAPAEAPISPPPPLTPNLPPPAPDIVAAPPPPPPVVVAPPAPSAPPPQTTAPQVQPQTLVAPAPVNVTVTAPPTTTPDAPSDKPAFNPAWIMAGLALLTFLGDKNSSE